MTVVVENTGGAEVGRSEGTGLCRVTILADRLQTDLAMPADVPLATLIPEIVSVIDEHREEPANRRNVAGPTEWTLGKLGRAALDPSRSLSELRVRDGELLLLQAAGRPAPAPLFDDLMHNVAAVEADAFRRWTPAAARVTGCITTVASTAVGSTAVLLARRHDSGLAGMIAALVVALALLVVATVVARVYRDTVVAVTLWCSALAPAFAAGALVVPGTPGAPALLLGAVTCCAFAVSAARATGVGAPVAVAVAITTGTTATSAGLLVLTDLPVGAIGAIACASGLVLLGCAPRIAMLLARLPLPPVPSPGSPVDTEESTATDTRPPSFEGLEVKARTARSLLTGLLCAAATVTASGAVVAANAGAGTDWRAVALAAVSAVVLMLRGRTYASLVQAAMLIGSGTALLMVLLIGVAVERPEHAPVVMLVAVLGVGAALTIGVVAPHHEFSPVQRRALELVDYAAIAAVLPLACWVAGLFGAMRGL